jgi:hypothetical protein
LALLVRLILTACATLFVVTGIASAEPVTQVGSGDLRTTPAGAPRPEGAPPAGVGVSDDAMYSYNGTLIPRDTAASAGLACFKQDVKARMRCYANRDEMAQAEEIATPAQYRAAASAHRQAATKRGHRHPARAANHMGSNTYPLMLYQHTYYSGWSVATNSYCTWFNLDGFYDNNASSAEAGQHTGFGAQYANGQGATVTFDAWTASNNLGTAWNDSISSRARACI